MPVVEARQSPGVAAPAASSELFNAKELFSARTTLFPWCL
jgi:hypothetical protein